MRLFFPIFLVFSFVGLVFLGGCLCCTSPGGGGGGGSEGGIAVGERVDVTSVVVNPAGGVVTVDTTGHSSNRFED